MHIKDLILNLIFPRYCNYCGSLGQKLCNKCKRFLKPEDFTLCAICENLCLNGTTHNYCKKNNPLAPDIYRYNYEYNFMSKEIVLSAKGKALTYTNIESLFKQDIVLFFKKLKLDCIVPIPPSNNSKRLEDIVLYFANNLSKQLSIPINKILLNSGETQKMLNKTDRLTNAQNKFKIRAKALPVDNQKIILIDDIATTGSSLLNACKLLKQSGTTSVYCYTLCKDLRYNHNIYA